MFLLFQKHKLFTWYSKGFETSISDEKSAYGNELSFIYTEQIGTFDPWKATFLKIPTSNVFYPWGCFNVHSHFNSDIYQMCIFWIVNHHILNKSYKVFFFFKFFWDYSWCYCCKCFWKHAIWEHEYFLCCQSIYKF